MRQKSKREAAEIRLKRVLLLGPIRTNELGIHHALAGTYQEFPAGLFKKRDKD